MGTIGMAEIDYFVSDPQHIPPAYVELSAAMRDACPI
jgi:predicted O-linked N-acetylglucosamine transferase (SPINDLY family)